MITLHTNKGTVEVNPLLVRSIFIYWNGDEIVGSKIMFDERHHILVNETPAQVKDLMVKWERNNV
jgi:hypothetical protein